VIVKENISNRNCWIYLAKKLIERGEDVVGLDNINDVNMQDLMN
jgi:hypothetical protein